MGSGKKVVSGVVWTLAANVVNAVYGFISVPILSRYSSGILASRNMDL